MGANTTEPVLETNHSDTHKGNTGVSATPVALTCAGGKGAVSAPLLLSNRDGPHGPELQGFANTSFGISCTSSVAGN